MGRLLSAVLMKRLTLTLSLPNEDPRDLVLKGKVGTAFAPLHGVVAALSIL